jgi:hypothetical protein
MQQQNHQGEREREREERKHPIKYVTNNNNFRWKIAQDKNSNRKKSLWALREK